MKSFPRFSVLSAFLLTGCVSTSSSPSLPSSSGTDPIPSADVRHISGASSWKLTPTDQLQVYSSQITTVITQTDIPISRKDSLLMQVMYSISMMRNSDNISYSGALTSFLLQRNIPDSAEISITTPILFTGKLGNHSISTRVSASPRVQDQNDCTNPAQTPLKIIQRNLFLMPFELTAGQTWTDSTSSTTCNGNLPIASILIRTLTAIGESELEGISVLVLDENERTFSKGEGSQGQHRILIESQGLTNGRFYINRISGQLIMANNTNKTSVSIQSSGRIQRFLQNSTEITRKTQ